MKRENLDWGLGKKNGLFAQVAKQQKGKSKYWREEREESDLRGSYRRFNSVSTAHQILMKAPGPYWASSAQGFMAVMEMLCPLHLKIPASHSDIVSSLPFTSTQMLYPCSWHSDASLQTHLLF